ncbi:Trp biosynthesis-associated membrane protein [Frondihabitans sp. VKM Ac-2883]|uniref:Trp biosynthesis-associated membrane protein n=1 Tax=Frondihabitans sp. VKM Ac-2883 TaxID=2783823 RepID=UPI00188AB592|nr:Trp biosynthesis-associated membrane protein [Frondihabitans sp. VKM Ac-2883]MBF4576547.1 Trp biosynthesis-associated membrane protein [Frondihabitans sp. VKM Ac-2883]
MTITPQRTRSTKLPSILAGLALAGLTLLTYTQTWVNSTVTSPSGGTVRVVADGSAAAPALSALALAGLALFGAITIAGPVFRVILGVLEILLGGCVALSAILAVSDPIGAAAHAITKLTGVDGDSSVRDIVQNHSMTAWPWVALLAGVAMAALGVAVILTSKRWPASTRRYQAVRLVDENGTTDPVVAWDTLSTGADPTARGEDDPNDNR